MDCHSWICNRSNIEGHSTSASGVGRIEIWVDRVLLRIINSPTMDGSNSEYELDIIYPVFLPIIF